MISHPGKSKQSPRAAACGVEAQCQISQMMSPPVAPGRDKVSVDDYSVFGGIMLLALWRLWLCCIVGEPVPEHFVFLCTLDSLVPLEYQGAAVLR